MPVDGAVYLFHGFRLEVSERQLFHHEELVPLTPKAFEILLCLVENAGHLVLKQDLLTRVWADSFIEEANLSQQIYLLRRMLGDDPHESRLIQTVPKSGYRFIAPLEQLQPKALPEPTSNVAAPIPNLAPRRNYGMLALVSALALIVSTGTFRLLHLENASATRIAEQKPAPLKTIPPSVAPYTPSAEVSSYYSRGLYHLNRRTDPELRKAIAEFKRAAAQDPNFAPALAGLADAYALSAYYGFSILPQDDSYHLAQQYAEQALAINDSLPAAHLTMALLYSHYQRNAAKADQEYSKAIAAAPSDPATYQRYSLFLVEQGRLDDGLRQISRALELNPVSPNLNTNYCLMLYYKRNYDQAERFCRAALEIDATLPHPTLLLAMIAEQRGQSDEAIRLLEKAKAMAKGNAYSEVLEALGHAYGVAGETEKARKLITEIEKKSENRVYSVGIHTALGELDQAFAVLNDQKSGGIEGSYKFILDPRFEPLRLDRRFGSLFQSIH